MVAFVLFYIKFGSLIARENLVATMLIFNFFFCLKTWWPLGCSKLNYKG
jgi:hypothetical protein